jgi:hypothetical protein
MSQLAVINESPPKISSLCLPHLFTGHTQWPQMQILSLPVSLLPQPFEIPYYNYRRLRIIARRGNLLRCPIVGLSYWLCKSRHLYMLERMNYSIKGSMITVGCDSCLVPPLKVASLFTIHDCCNPRDCTPHMLPTTLHWGCKGDVAYQHQWKVKS